jgi:hypothetical protein
VKRYEARLDFLQRQITLLKIKEKGRSNRELAISAHAEDTSDDD